MPAEHETAPDAPDGGRRGDGVDLSELTVQALLGLEYGIVDELRRRTFVRTQNKPLGDIAEQIVWRARRGTLEPNSTPSHDVTTPAGQRIQVKAVAVRAGGARVKFSPFRSFGFDSAVFLVFDAPSFELVLAREVPVAGIPALGRYSQHTNGTQLPLSKVRDAGVDVITEMRRAYAALNTDPAATAADGR